MSLMLRLAAVSLALCAVHSPAFAAPAGTAGLVQVRACVAEAQWPVESSAAYRYGSARERQQLRNSVNADIRAEEALCRDLAEGGGDKAALMERCDGQAAAVEQAYGERARDHADRLRGLCRAMTGA